MPDGNVEEECHENEELGAFFDEEQNVEIDIQNEKNDDDPDPVQVIDEVNEIGNVAPDENAMEDAYHDMNDNTAKEEVDDFGTGEDDVT